MKPVLLSLFCAALMTSACTTISLTDNPAESSLSKTASKAHNAILQSASRLSYVFSKENWSQNAKAESTQSAASILLKGLKSSSAPSNNTENYARKVANVQAIGSDIIAAQNYVDLITIEANELLKQNPDIQDVKSELGALEKALISSRQAEATFSNALSVRGAGQSETAYLSNYKQSVDGLRAITDAYGERLRNQPSKTASS